MYKKQLFGLDQWFLRFSLKAVERLVGKSQNLMLIPHPPAKSETLWVKKDGAGFTSELPPNSLKLTKTKRSLRAPLVSTAALTPQAAHRVRGDVSSFKAPGHPGVVRKGYQVA